MDVAKKSDETTRTQTLKDMYARKKETAQETAKKADEKTGTFKIVTERDDQVSTGILDKLAMLMIFSSTPTSPTTPRSPPSSESSRLRILPRPAENGDHPPSTCSTHNTLPLPVEHTPTPSRTLATRMPTHPPLPLHEARTPTVPVTLVLVKVTLPVRVRATLLVRDTQLEQPVRDTLPVPPLVRQLTLTLDTTLLSVIWHRVRLDTVVRRLSLRGSARRSGGLCKVGRISVL
jgi:hypothetical protein